MKAKAKKKLSTQAAEIHKELELANSLRRRLSEIGVNEKWADELSLDLIGSRAIFLRQRKPGTRTKYRSMTLFPDEGWTLDSVRRMLDKPW